jgi:acyl phosphate:glycerol-3-phosphate acyltransferase
MTRYILCAVIGYLIGNISPSYLLGRGIKNIDIREHGSGNAGATNTFRVLGSKMGLLVFLCDVLKGVVSVFIGRWIGGEYGGIISAVSAISGHNWPIVLGFKGGKGIAASLGTLFILAPDIALIMFAIGVVIILTTKYVSLASIITTILLPICIWIRGYSRAYIVYGVIIAAMALYRHKSNISRLISGKENKIKIF